MLFPQFERFFADPLTGLTEYFRDSNAELAKLLGPGFACDEAQPVLSVTSESRK